MKLSSRLFLDEEFKPEYNIFISFKPCKMIAFRLDLMDYVDFFAKSINLKKR